MKCKLMHLDAAEKSTDVPALWPVFNAPRPLCGTKHWQGEFRHGVFYAAVDPADSMALRFAVENANLDAYLCVYVTFEEVRRFVVDYYARLYPDTPIDMSDASTIEIWQTFRACKERESGDGLESDAIIAAAGTSSEVSAC